MILSMSRQAVLFLLTVCVGAVIGFIYDIFRIIRKVAPHRTVLIQAEDLIFWLMVTFLMFYFMLYVNYGEIRLFSILGAVLGVVLYFSTISKLVIGVSVAVVNFIKQVVATVLRILFTPFRLLIKLLTPPLTVFGRFLRKRLRSAGRYAKMKTRNTVRSWSIMRKKV